MSCICNVCLAHYFEGEFWFLIHFWLQHYIIWNPVHLVYGCTRQYVQVHPGMYASGDMAVREASKWYVPVCTDIENS